MKHPAPDTINAGDAVGQMTAAVVARGWRSIFSSLENRSYRWFWLSLLASFTAMQMQTLARGWLAYDLTKSPLTLGWVTFATGLPMLLLSALGGTITDRVEKRNLLISTQVLAGVGNLVVAVLISVGDIEVWHLIVASVFTGIIFAFNMPGRQSAIPELVGRERLMNAIALNSGAMNLTRIVAPALGGVLIAIIGIEWVYYLTVAFFIVAAALLFMIPPLGTRARDSNSTVRSETVAGFSYVRRSPILLALFTLAFVPVVFGMPYQLLLPAFAVEILDVGASGLGLLMAAVGIGALVASLAVASLGNFRHKGLLLLSASTVFGLFLVLFAASNHLSLSLFLLVGVGAASISYMAVNNTLIQLNCDDTMRGRVMGIYMVTFGLFPLGTLPVSAIGEAVGMQLAIGMGGAIVVLLTVALALFRPELRKL